MDTLKEIVREKQKGSLKTSIFHKPFLIASKLPCMVPSGIIIHLSQDRPHLEDIQTALEQFFYFSSR